MKAANRLSRNSDESPTRKERIFLSHSDVRLSTNVELFAIIRFDNASLSFSAPFSASIEARISRQTWDTKVLNKASTFSLKSPIATSTARRFSPSMSTVSPRPSSSSRPDASSAPVSGTVTAAAGTPSARKSSRSTLRLSSKRASVLGTQVSFKYSLQRIPRRVMRADVPARFASRRSSMPWSRNHSFSFMAIS